MTFDDIVDLAEKAGCDVSAMDGREYQTMWCDSYQLERFAAALIQAGAASRDAEVEALKERLEVSDTGLDGIACRNETIRLLENSRSKLREQVFALRSEMQHFVDRVDIGSIRSVRTYAKFKELIAETEPK